jgi:nucleotide-binding universal stress UspA family protein
MFKKILIANDGSEGGFRAMSAALRLAHSHKARAHMICVEEMQWIPGSREEVIGDKELADRKYAEVVAKCEAEAKRSPDHRGFHRTKSLRSARHRLHGTLGAVQPRNRLDHGPAGRTRSL